MTDRVPQVIRDVGFDFHWDAKRVWALDVAAEAMDIAMLRWHLDVPFLGEGGVYNLKPREVLADPASHREEYDRTMRADFNYPIDIMTNKGRWVILDGLHRMMKAYATGLNRVQVRKIPREFISLISM